MSYTVLARKFRSQTFDEVVGQSAITTTLKNAIRHNRIHHGYLFCGTRGVGKTSMARIFAKCLNCLSFDAPTLSPCGTCDSCQNIARGEDMDVVEIDAASNTGVDNIRELRSNAVYRPARARFKIYIIDEVHMLSSGAFNALLKTLEEPPSHVKFILATTEVQKVPATILSRVQRFDFKSIAPAEIAEQLKRICLEEKIQPEDAALKRIARLAAGSMRDALSLLDQAISMSGESLTSETVNSLFPTTHDEGFADLIDRIAEEDAAGALAFVDQTLGQGTTPEHWCSRLIAQLRDLMLVRVCGRDTDMIDIPAGLRDRLYTQSQRFDSGALVYMIALLEELRRSARSSNSARALVEAAVVRLAESARFSSIETLLTHVNNGSTPARIRSTEAAPPSPRGAAPAARPATLPPEPQRTTATPPLKKPPRALAPAPEPAGPARRVTQADLKAAHAEPLVKAALDVFGGRIIDVQRGGSAGTPAGDFPS